MPDQPLASPPSQRPDRRPDGGDRWDDESTPDAGALPALDLSPRTSADDAQARRDRRRAKRWPAVVVLAVVVLVGGFVMVRALGNATLFFYNADEAVAQRQQLGTTRFRLQGTVVGGSVARTGDGVNFDVRYHEVVVPVHHVGDPPQLFQPGVPVVLEGSWGTGDAFASDRILVKHTEEYDEKNEDRLREATEGGSGGATAGTVP
jgi:cytochrome c-type biogenesis protein CcmE